ELLSLLQAQKQNRFVVKQPLLDFRRCYAFAVERATVANARVKDVIWDAELVRDRRTKMKELIGSCDITDADAGHFAEPLGGWCFADGPIHVAGRLRH